MKRFRVICLAVATLELLIVVFVFGNSMHQRQSEGRPAETRENVIGEFESESEAADPVYMRVMLKTTDFTSYEHENLVVRCESPLHLTGSKTEACYPGEQSLRIDLQHPLFQEGMLRLTSEGAPICIESIKRRGQVHSYEGVLELYPGETGIVIVNELPIEAYVERVTASEMPAAYGVEAAMLQAVCARTYAYERILHQKVIGPFGAYADDSTTFQVYNSAGSTSAAREGTQLTQGMIMTYREQPVIPYYFSTSCGYTASPDSLSKNHPYLQSRNLTADKAPLSTEEEYSSFLQNWEASAVESGMCWFRWSCEIPGKQLRILMEGRLHQLQAEDPQRVRPDNGSLEDILKTPLSGIIITQRAKGGMVTGLKVQYQGGSISVSGELNIRRLLGAPERTYINLSEKGISQSEGDYLPSAFFTIFTRDGDADLRYVICGGGNGHGIGMSQNAAYRMLEAGVGWREILQFFYQGIAFSTIK